MADGLIQNYSSGAGRVLTRQFRQAQGGHVGLKPNLQATPRQRLHFSTYVFFLLFSAFCCADELPDPTRPPASLLTPVAAGGTEAAPAPAGLQSIIISKTRRAAIIDGETVELGGKHGDAKLIEVNEGSVVLRGAQGRQVMTLFPDVKMTLSRTPAGNKEQKVKTKPQSPKSPQSPESKVQPEGQKENQALTGGDK